MPRIIVVLNAPETDLAYITYARHVLTCLSDTSLFPSPNPPLSVLESAVVALEQAQALTLRRGKGDADDRNAKRVVVQGYLEMERGYVQTLAGRLPAAEGLELVAQSAFSAKKSSGYAREPFRVRHKPGTNWVTLAVTAEKRNTVYYWQYSKDGVTWIDLEETGTAKTKVDDLTLGVRYWFRYRTKAKAVLGNWSDPLVYLVA